MKPQETLLWLAVADSASIVFQFKASQSFLYNSSIKQSTENMIVYFSVIIWTYLIAFMWPTIQSNRSSFTSVILHLLCGDGHVELILKMQKQTCTPCSLPEPNLGQLCLERSLGRPLQTKRQLSLLYWLSRL